MFGYLILIAGLTILDQLTKAMISSNPSAFANVEVIPGFFYITYVKNAGAAWSMLSGQRVFLSLISAAAVIGMLWVLQRTVAKKQKLNSLALSLMIAGALGNLIDRLMLGSVRDFLNFYIFGYDFPVFNVADICLTIGVGLLILATILEPDSPKTEETDHA
jgi:signal peptidase II